METVQENIEQTPAPGAPKGHALTASIGRNTLLGVACSIAQIATRFVTVPLVILYLGLDGYGIWAIVMAVAAYMRFGTAGVKSAFQKYVAEATGTGDYDKANKLISTGSVGILVLSLIGLAPVALFSHSLARFASVPDQFLEAAAGSITVLAVIMVMANFGAAYEAIVQGAHRIDLARRFNIILSVVEAVAIIYFLRRGFGLFAMAIIMAASELVYVLCCYFAARHVLPQVRVRMRYVTSSVIGELVRFAGTYQLVALMEVVYAAIVPVVVLKFFGAETAGLFAVAGRLVSAALLPQEAFVLPILSGGTLVYVSSSAEKMGEFVHKTFKAALILTVLPLAFVAVFGRTMVVAWTGETDTAFRAALWLMCLGSVFKALAVLEFVLYRVSGRALIDNLRQVLRLLVLLVLVVFGRQLGFYGVLSALVVAEFLGMVLMYFGLRGTFEGFNPRMLAPDAMKLLLAAAVILGVGALTMNLQLPWGTTERVVAAYKLGLICLGCALAALPALLLTGAVSGSDSKTLLSIFSRKLSNSNAGN